MRTSSYYGNDQWRLVIIEYPLSLNVLAIAYVSALMHETLVD